MELSEALKKLNDLEAKEFAYNHALGILSYDGETSAPKGGAEPRGRTMGILSGEVYKLSTGEEAMRILDALREHMDELSEGDRRRVELREKSMRELRAIPQEEYTGYQELLNEVSAVWHEAKVKSDYPMFEPSSLSRIWGRSSRPRSVLPDLCARTWTPTTTASTSTRRASRRSGATSSSGSFGGR